MVQKKLGIQPDHVKSEKGLDNLEPSSSSSSSRHQLDGKNRGADLKKKMKKSRSIKRSDFDSVRSLRQGKTPPLVVPNYMKSTSSFDARREASQSRVISQNSQTCVGTKNSNNSKRSSASGSGHKAARTLTRTSNLKPVRTLTKSPSFKQVRASAKKCSPVVVCENLDVERATCSSTLKDSKFPNYLTLNPGATESEGTSVMKVCPYTYCSLNGHHHPPLPPLKCFLSTRRRMLKTQKSMKLGCLSHYRQKSTGEFMKEIDAGRVIFAEKTTVQKLYFNSSPIAPLMPEEQTNFFIEIYTKDGEDTAASSSKQGGVDKDMADFSAEEEVENPPSIHSDEQYFEASDIEWVASATSLDDVAILKSSGIDNSRIHDEPIFNSQILADEESLSSQAWFDDGYSELDGSYQNLESFEFILLCNYQSDNCLLSPTYEAFEQLTTTEETYGNGKSDESGTLGTETSWGPMEELIEEPKAASEDKNVIGEENNEFTRMDLQLGDDEIKCTSDIEDEVLIDHGQDNESLQDGYACMLVLVGNQEFETRHDFTEQDQDEVSIKDYTESPKSTEVYQSDCGIERRFSDEAFVGSLLPKTENCHVRVPELPTADAIASDGMEEKEKEPVDAAKSLVGVQTFYLLQGFSEAGEDNDESKLGATAKDSASNQTLGDHAGLPAETLEDHSSNKQCQSNNVLENDEQAEKDGDESENYKISNSMDSEDQTQSGIMRLGLVENKGLDVEKKEVEQSNATNFIFPVESNSNQELPETCNNPRGTIRFRCNSADEEWKEARKFNPKEPNYMSVEADPEAERIYLRHQMTDERKNAEEWMVDYALRQAVTKLAPARNRKVALLVEAFETVVPIPKYKTHPRHTSTVLAHSMPIQACR